MEANLDNSLERWQLMILMAENLALPWLRQVPQIKWGILSSKLNCLFGTGEVSYGSQWVPSFQAHPAWRRGRKVGMDEQSHLQIVGSTGVRLVEENCVALWGADCCCLAEIQTKKTYSRRPSCSCEESIYYTITWPWSSWVKLAQEAITASKYKQNAKYWA